MRSKILILTALLAAALIVMAAAPSADTTLTPLPKNNALPEGWTTPVNISPNLTFWSHEPRLITNA
ncbi:MAG: hypothetical protein JW742_08575, partial [Candidatus Aminicenantes bacterium]|nr:hypothetical protein [Candidatus Aminicenantes bacterium]